VDWGKKKGSRGEGGQCHISGDKEGGGYISWGNGGVGKKN